MSGKGFEITGIDHIVLRSAQADKLRDFYVEVLGCSVARERPDLGLTHLRAGRSMIDLVEVDGKLGRAGGAAPGPEARNLDHICLTILPYDVERLRDYLAGHGVELLEPGQRFGAEGDGPSFYVKDPDGNTVELKGPPNG